MRLEKLTRILIILPAPTTFDAFMFVDDVVGELLHICDGVTVSLDIPPVFWGQWINRQTRHKVPDESMLVFSDAPFSLDDADLDDWIDWLEDLKTWCQEKFNQSIIWMTLQRVDRIAAYDYQKVWIRTLAPPQ
jgi:hypothetical protein